MSGQFEGSDVDLSAVNGKVGSASGVANAAELVAFTEAVMADEEVELVRTRKALLSAVPVPDPTAEAQRQHQVLQGEVPSPMNPPSGCVFHPRCPLAVDSCRLEIPPLEEKRPGHWVACTQV